MDEFLKLREELELEIDARFDHQDEIIDNLSNSIKTFQDTMKIIGQTVFWYLILELLLLLNKIKNEVEVYALERLEWVVECL